MMRGKIDIMKDIGSHCVIDEVECDINAGFKGRRSGIFGDCIVDC